MTLQKDLNYLQELQRYQREELTSPLDRVKLDELLKTYHPVSDTLFNQEMEDCVEYVKLSRCIYQDVDVFRFLKNFVKSAIDQGRKPIIITDWDGTMKDYCSQYATNLQVSK